MITNKIMMEPTPRPFIFRIWKQIFRGRCWT